MKRTPPHKAKRHSLKGRLDFETLLADISGRFVNISADRVDAEIDRALKAVCDRVGFDIGVVWQFSTGQPKYLTVKNLYRPLGGPPVPDTIDAEEVFPWTLRELRAGRIVAVSADTAPAEAGRDQEMLRHYGVKSTLTYPMRPGKGDLVGALSLNTTGGKKTWSEDFRARIQLVADLFANAIARKLSYVQLRESEDRLTLTSDSAGIGHWILDPDTGRFWCSAKIFELLDVPVDSVLDVEAFTRLIHPEDRQMVTDALNDALHGSVLPHDRRIEYRIVPADNSVRWLASIGRPQLNASGEIERIMGISCDISHRKFTEEALQQSKENLRDRLHFEQLLSGTSARLAWASPESLNQEIEHTLASVLDNLGVDRCGLLQSFNDKSAWRIAYAANAQSLPELPSGTYLSASRFPYIYRIVVDKRKPFVFETIDDLPALDAGMDRQTFRHWGIRSAMIVPITVGDSCSHIVTVTTDRSERAWPQEYIQRLQLLGEIFVNAIERGKAEKGLREREAWLRSILSASPVGITFMAADGMIEWINDGFTTISSYTTEEMTGQSCRVLYETEEEFNRVQETISGGPQGRWPLQTKWVRRDGQVRDVVVRAGWVDPGDASAGLVLAGGDVTEQKRMEESVRMVAEEWQATFDAVPDLIMVLDREHRVVRANQATFSFLRLPADKVIGSPCYALMHQTKCPLPECPVTDLMNSHRHEEAEIYDGEREAWFHVSTDPILDETGEIIRIIHRVRDMTEQKRMEAETSRARRDMLRLERLLLMGELSASLAHELNQPLTAILANAKAATRYMDTGRFDAGKQKTILTNIANDVKRAGDVIRSLRSMVKAEERESEILSMTELLGDAVTLFRSEAIIRNIKVEVDIPKDLPCAKVDRVQIQQVIVNLMMNGVEAMECEPASERKLIVRARRANDAIRVAVRDFGRGIGVPETKKLFEPFFTTKDSGLGMGLALSRAVMEAHGGYIWGEDNPDKGATFYFDLPITNDQT